MNNKEITKQVGLHGNVGDTGVEKARRGEGEGKAGGWRGEGKARGKRGEDEGRRGEGEGGF